MGRDGRVFEVSQIYYFLIVVACMNFMSSGSLIFLGLTLYELFRRNFVVELSGKAIAAIVLAVSIFLTSYAYYGMSECVKAVNYALVYILGYDGYFRVSDKRAYVEKTMSAIALGFGVELILMFIYNYGRKQVSIRSMYSVWTRSTISVTLLGLLASVVIGYSFYVFFWTKNIRMKLLMLIMVVVGIWFGLETATRTPLVMFCVVYIVMGLVYIFSKRGVRAMGTVLTITVLGIFFYFMYSFDLGGIRSAIMETPVFRRFEFAGLESGRVEIMIDHFNYTLRYPWGGSEIFERVGFRAHNFLQEGHDMYGIFAFGALMVITLQALNNMMKILTRKDKSEVDFLFLCMYLATLVQMCLEPVFNGYPILLWSFLIIHGMGNAYIRESKETESAVVDE